MNLRKAVEEALFLNELDGNPNAIYRFSDAGGKSGLSFGRCQYDVENNATAVKCLQECGFTASEIAALKNKHADLAVLNAKLKAAADVVDRYDAIQVSECLNHVMTVARTRGFSYADDLAIVMAADYHNQFYMSTSGKMAMHLAGVGRAVTAEDIHKFKLTLPWGKKRLDDVERRYRNVLKVCNQP